MAKFWFLVLLVSTCWCQNFVNQLPWGLNSKNIEDLNSGDNVMQAVDVTRIETTDIDLETWAKQFDQYYDNVFTS